LAESEAKQKQLLEALILADAALVGANMNMTLVKRKVDAAIERATLQPEPWEEHANG
jgi:hypothetical protein